MEGGLPYPTQIPPAPKRTLRKRGRRGGGGKKKEKKKLDEEIYNLTGVEFNNQELEVLQQGLKFAPNKDVDKFDLFIDIEKHIRKCNIKKYFAGRNIETTASPTDPFCT